MTILKETSSALNNAPLLEVSNIVKRFGEKTALNNVSFTVEKGSPIALVGPNGAGKTTLFSLLCGYIQPTSGQVKVMGHQAGSVNTFGRLAALPQDANLDPRFAIAQQLKFYAKLQGFSSKQSQIEAERTLELVGLSEVLNQKPEALSHGMRKRVAIAQTLIGSPDIIMLDEATAGLDPIHARDVRELVAQLSDNITFILSSHDLNELERLCERVLYIENGTLKQHQAIEQAANVSTNNTTNGETTSNEGCGVTQYLTLRMAHNIDDFQNAFASIKAVTKVQNTQDREYLLTIAPQGNKKQPIDIELLTLCHNNQWQYKQLINGRTLENQLFN